MCVSADVMARARARGAPVTRVTGKGHAPGVSRACSGVPAVWAPGTTSVCIANSAEGGPAQDWYT